MFSYNAFVSDTGNLALSRALGDFVFKKNDKKRPEEQIVTGLYDIKDKMQGFAEKSGILSSSTIMYNKSHNTSALIKILFTI